MVRSDGWEQDIPACDTDRPASSMSWSMEKAPVLMSSLSSAAAALAERVCSCQLCFIGSPTWGSGFSQLPTDLERHGWASGKLCQMAWPEGMDLCVLRCWSLDANPQESREATGLGISSCHRLTDSIRQ